MKNLKKDFQERLKKQKMMKNNFYKVFLSIAVLFLINSAAVAESKSEFVAFGLKFLHIALLVIVAIVIIYVGLLVYKKFNQPLKSKMFNPREQNRLIASKNLDDAIEHFIKDSE